MKEDLRVIKTKRNIEAHYGDWMHRRYNIESHSCSMLHLCDDLAFISF